MTQSLTEFIASVRLADSIDHERFLINSEQADVRTYIRQCEPIMRPRIVAKLIFLYTLGQNVAYGQVEVLTLMSMDQFSYKRIGYIAAALLLDEASELAVLITHTITKDLQSSDARIQSLALTLISNIGSPEMCRSVAADVLKLVDNTNTQILKRTAMAGLRIVDRVPELAENFKPVVQKLLKHGSHGVVIAAINLMSHIMVIEPSYKTSWSRYAPAFTKILKQLSTTKAPREFAFTVFNDPFLQIRVLKVLSELNTPSEELDEALESIVTGIDVKRNSGRALLFQAVETIVTTAKKGSLRGLAFSQIGRLFRFKEANVLYSALSVYSRVLYSGTEIIDRTSGDSIALQRYKSNVVQCLSHRDSSIRRRALDVISALVDEKNVETLIPEVLDYVKLADSEFRVELVSKIFTAVQRFATDPIWNFDIVHRILVESGNYIGSDIFTATCRLISSTPILQQHAVQQLSGSLTSFGDNQTLIQVSAWVLGEYLPQDDNVIEGMKKLLLLPQTSDLTKGYLITSISKLAIRFGIQNDIAEFLGRFARSSSLDVQQRAGEMAHILSSNEVSEVVLAPVGTGDDEARPATQDSASLLDMVSSSPTPPPQTETKSENSAMSLLDILSSPGQAPAPQPKKAGFTCPPGAVEGLRRDDYVLCFEIKKNPQNPKQIALRVSMFGLGNTPLQNFAVKYGVNQGWAIQAQAPSANRLDPAGSQPILQQLFAQSQTDSPLVMRVQITYMYGSQPITEVGEINPIFG